MIMAFPEGISDIQYYLFSISSVFKYKRNINKLSPMTMSESLITHNSSVTDVNIELIVEIKYQLHILHLEESFIQGSYNSNFQHLC